MSVSKYAKVKFEPDSLLDIRKDTTAIERLAELSELVNVPVERGGFYFSDWEREFVRKMNDAMPAFTPAQREKIDEIWHNADKRKRGGPGEKSENLFSKLSPAEQERQRARAAKVRLPWE